MINKIDIANFGSFRDLIWKKNFRDSGGTIQNFKQLNIIYGRNYSGKTTLSRIFRSLETARIPLHYETPVFTIYGDKGDVTQTNIASHSYDIRVYNRDFVNENLSFLTNNLGGVIKTFAIVGEENKEIENLIAAIEASLGSVEAKTGLRHELESKRKERDRAKNNHEIAFENLEDKLRSHANDKIKRNHEYGEVVYNIESIKRDIDAIKKTTFKALSTEEQTFKLGLLKQEALPDIPDSINVNLKIDSIKKIAESVLSRIIIPTQPIQELLNDNILQLWVKEGISIHKGKRDTCAFCRQNLPHDIWDILDSHFNKESSNLESEINECLLLIKSEIKIIPSFITLMGDRFYARERIQFEEKKNALIEALNIYKQDLQLLQSALDTRKGSLFQTVDIPELSYDSDAIQRHVETINILIAKSNGRTRTLENDKKSARNALRLTDVACFIDSVKYDYEKNRIAILKADMEAANTAYSEAEKVITSLENKIIQLRNEQKDERKGAEQVNRLLNHFFGHDGIKLETRDDPNKSAVKFEITRNGKSAYNLSEGECSLIALCYFIAKLKEPRSKDKELIIYIDDPVSSLDSNHIFFMFSLIESLISKPIKNVDGNNLYCYEQFFISTHNLDFLKYLKRVSLPSEKKQGGYQYFLIQFNGVISNISLMPSYLKDYITEFNYLFHQIYKCRDPNLAKENYEPFYSFGNNLRKFLEAFLFYKYPCRDDKNSPLEERIKRFFDDDDMAAVLGNRVINELSHLESSLERGIKPVEIPEIPKLANYVLDKIYAADHDQYNALLKSIGEPERVG